jgi:3-oxoacyl-[acyl-carrier-protein] synthase II
MTPQKVVITGMGCVSSLGNSPQDLFTALLENKTAVRFFDEWAQLKGLYAHLGAPAMPYNIKDIPRSVRRTMSPMSEMAALATTQALDMAGLKDINSPRTLLILGSTTGSAETYQQYFKLMNERGGPEGQVSTTFFKVMNHSVAANVGAALNFNGPYLSPSSACATSAQAMIMGWELLQTGLYDCVIAGGADEMSALSSATFDVVHAASRGFNKNPEQTPRPFDKNRDGLVVSEGAGVLIMETEVHAKNRNAKSIAQFAGGSYNTDCSHMSQSHQEAMIKTMNAALERSNMPLTSIDYVNAHATGTIHGDVEEAQAIGKVFGDRAAVSSLKGFMGHSLAACGALEAIACIKMLEMGKLIPTRNLRDTDSLCEGLWLLKEGMVVDKKISAIMSNNFAFGGMNTSIVLAPI